ncbi:methyltransferase [Nocardioides sp. KIGAM211]|uniref:Methyltransferase n=1 Tax=Nocardioides luti TaxID=2761101 RepID=A0A7X0RGA0_9ACTN|nr:methyltransferase [Nocardioides luti]MBB6627781.1 methyltransferase [Nocardioides luti]
MTTRTDDAVPARETLPFGPLEIAFDSRLLRPRAWTAAQSSWVAELLPGAPAGPVLELCSGAGHIGLLAVLDADRDLVCVDVNPAAAERTRENALAAGLGDRVETRCAPIASALHEDERFAAVVADPPWVPAAETGRFPEDPLLAIDGGVDGLTVARECVAAIGRHLLTGGSAVLQLGTTAQVAQLEHLVAAYDGLGVVEVRTFERGVLARLTR